MNFDIYKNCLDTFELTLEILKDDDTDFIDLNIKECGLRFKKTKQRFYLENEFLKYNVITSTREDLDNLNSLFDDDDLNHIAVVHNVNRHKNIILVSVFMFTKTIQKDFIMHLNDEVSTLEEQLRNDQKKLTNISLSFYKPMINDLSFVELMEKETILKLFDKSYVLTAVYNKNVHAQHTLNKFYIVGKNHFFEATHLNNDLYTMSKFKSNLNIKNFVFTFIEASNFLYNDFRVGDNFKHDNFEYTEVVHEKLSDTNKHTYLDLWNKFSMLEQDLWFRNTSSLGYLPSSSRYTVKNGILKLVINNKHTKKLTNFKKAFPKGSMFLLSYNQPYAENIISFSNYETFVANKSAVFKAILAEDIDDSSNEICFKVNFNKLTNFYDRQNKDCEDSDIKVDNNSSYLDKTLYIMPSFTEDMSVFDRRTKAFERISSKENPMPNLIDILNGHITKELLLKKTLPDLPGYTRNLEKFFNGFEPSTNQLNCLKYAVNTPDIMLIQGPPGTGKTTIIQAISQRLADLSPTSDSMSILISSYQHDAVDNVISKTEISGVPILKIGKKNFSVRKQRFSYLNPSVSTWINKRNVELSMLHKNIDLKSPIVEFRKLYAEFTNVRSIPLTIKILEKIVANFDVHTFKKEITEIIDQFKYMEDNSYRKITEEKLLMRIRRIPYTETIYSDNGSTELILAIKSLKRTKDTFFDSYIAEMTEMYDSNKINFPRLEEIRKIILLRIVPKKQVFIDANDHLKIINIMKELSNHMEISLKDNKDSCELLIQQYMETIDKNPIKVQRSLLEYTTAIASTNQQALSNTMLRFKNPPHIKQQPVFSNVIVDEVARSNPADLIIPMSQAESKIILVGDQRQLPHSLDSFIVDSLMTNEDFALDDYLDLLNIYKISTFEYLMPIAHALEKHDSKIRVITLDTQYRMVPVLGTFVSDNFYAPFGEALKNGRPKEDFCHNLPNIENKACIWIDVKNDLGSENIAGTSKFRNVEALKIAEHIKTLLDSNESDNMNFGIITFYSKQVDAIYKALYDIGIFAKNDNTYVLKPTYYGKISDGKNRIKIGTIDAFQGMEFDIVYLSVVRSNNLTINKKEDVYKKFGFLASAERLCVSMSRQKKCLICVGDSEMFLDLDFEDENLIYLKSLHNYYNLCKESEYGQLQ